MPTGIEIVESFTRIKSFDNTKPPDGIELLLQAVNSLGNTGLMIVGDLRVELFDYVPASGNSKGRRLEVWEIELSTEEHQRAHWNEITQMYEFQLGADLSVVPTGRKFILAVTYNSPLGEHLQTECVLDYRLPTGARGAA